MVEAPNLRSRVFPRVRVRYSSRGAHVCTYKYTVVIVAVITQFRFMPERFHSTCYIKYIRCQDVLLRINVVKEHQITATKKFVYFTLHIRLANDCNREKIIDYNLCRRREGGKK